MAYTFVNNFNSFYYNMITNFYLFLNMFLPYYDDVIITFQKEALIDLFHNSDNPVSFKEIKRKRLINFLNNLEDDIDKILINDDKSLQIIYLPFVDEKVKDYDSHDSHDIDNYNEDKDSSDSYDENKKNS